MLSSMRSSAFWCFWCGNLGHITAKGKSYVCFTQNLSRHCPLKGGKYWLNMKESRFSDGGKFLSSFDTSEDRGQYFNAELIDPNSPKHLRKKKKILYFPQLPTPFLNLFRIRNFRLPFSPPFLDFFCAPKIFAHKVYRGSHYSFGQKQLRLFPRRERKWIKFEAAGWIIMPKTKTIIPCSFTEEARSLKELVCELNTGHLLFSQKSRFLLAINTFSPKS